MLNYHLNRWGILGVCLGMTKHVWISSGWGADWMGTSRPLVASSH